ncbi:MAG: hypothetical protein QOE11_3657 [Solirubrobacteraceae bacterium]|nr:hypothetical protein [Solirubrobacteraceae bacterium]
MRILFVTHQQWLATAGAVGQQVTLSEALAALGVTVEHISGVEMGYQRAANRVTRILHNPPAAAKAVRATRRVARHFDVVEGHQALLPLTAEQLGLRGVLAVRSAGIAQTYDAYLQADRAANPSERPHVLARLPRALQRRRALEVARRSYERADVAIALNADEDRVLREIRRGRRVELMTIGLPGAKLERLRLAARSPGERLTAKRAVFVGYWSRRKGAEDWPAILAETWRADADVQFCFLGTGLADDSLAAKLGVDRREVGERVVNHPRFTPDELPDLMSCATVAVLPSYAEGYPVGTVEAAAAGVPTIAYDTIGARELPRRVPGDWLVQAGDARSMAGLIAKTCQMSAGEFRGLAEHCQRLASEHSWDRLAPQLLRIYEETLEATPAVARAR